MNRYYETSTCLTQLTERAAANLRDLMTCPKRSMAKSILDLSIILHHNTGLFLLIKRS